MQETQTIQEVLPENVTVDEKAHVPLWLLMVYISLLTWSIWNILKYWD